ncbi:molybdopterin molybdotransferase MoeA [Simiduia curdlanivorans]|uniref:Molybdopterin molybdenumtransferase n=1 Tax=Simiduia curdlanivorans TaxID=1492769 RepID=A0ABV8VAG7_9GAMM|nr:gephyrin-like molybdotransferase Glp [Simiduia curdlanivorans]MDN3639068.1 molybdopterin molybdotransferase MoeA [Simiduia curdlanivorans]
MGCCDAPNLMPLDEAIAILHQQLEAITEQETVTLDLALDRILAQDIKAPIDVPGYDNSAMDGYALRFNDIATNHEFERIGKAFAGEAFDGRVGKGKCVRIMTGAPIPAGADTVVMQEDIQTQGKMIKLLHPASVKLGQHVRTQGADILTGHIVLTKGKRLGPTDIGLLASLGLSKIPLIRRLKVAILSTGSELKTPGQGLERGQIYDSNRYVLHAMLERLNVEIMDLGIVPDQPSALEEAFTIAAEQADLIFSSGGVSVGEADYTREILERMGDIAFWKIAIKPGKPLAFGKLGKAYFFGLPGNPVSATLTFHQVALPALQLLAGEKAIEPIRLHASVKNKLRKRPGRTDFQRAYLSATPSGLEVSADSDQSSGVLSSYTSANCYIKLDQFACDQDKGERVEVIPFDRWIG